MGLRYAALQGATPGTPMPCKLSPLHPRPPRPLPQVVMAAGLVVGAGVASTTLWYYSRRYLGELSLLPSGTAGQPPRLRFSVLDFWGNREVGGARGTEGLQSAVELPLMLRCCAAHCVFQLLPSPRLHSQSCSGQRRGAAGAGAAAGAAA